MTRVADDNDDYIVDNLITMIGRNRKPFIVFHGWLYKYSFKRKTYIREDKQG